MSERCIQVTTPSGKVLTSFRYTAQLGITVAVAMPTNRIPYGFYDRTGIYSGSYAGSLSNEIRELFGKCPNLLLCKSYSSLNEFSATYHKLTFTAKQGWRASRNDSNGMGL